MTALLSILLVAYISHSTALVPKNSMLRLHKSVKTTSTNIRMSSSSTDTKHVAIVGAGAAGLATARAFLRDGKFQVSVFESRRGPGGIWDYTSERDEKKSRPMYKNLRTNLPKELMQFREYPWTGTDDSYVTHTEVKKYLKSYCDEFDLERHIQYGCTVEQLTVLNDNGDEEWPQIALQWQVDGETQQQTFDNVCICNGHYSLPSYPNLRGIDFFKGQVIHAIEYDNANEYTGKTVLCVGARASGADIAREIGLVAKHRVFK